MCMATHVLVSMVDMTMIDKDADDACLAYTCTGTVEEISVLC